MWVATLMWTGQRPEHPLVEQSESAFHNALALAMSEMPAGTCDLEAGDLGSYNTSPNFCSVPGSDNSVAVYLHSKGILKVVNDNSAVCEVQEPEGCRNVEFFTFYRNNVPHVGHLKNVLRENDVVQIDYMVGTVGGREEVCCRLVWQGKKPSDVRQTSPAEFGLLLKARTAQEKVLPAPVYHSHAAEDREGQAVFQALTLLLSRNWELAVCLQDPVAPNGHRQIRLERDWLTSKMATPYGKTTTARHPPEPTVYVFLGRKGTVMQVCDSAAMVEAREGQSIREVTVTADCFYREGRTVLTNLNRVLHKGEIVNIDYMVGRMGCKDSIHCNLAWQGRKPQRVPCLSPDEFKEKIIARGSGSTFIDDLQSTSQELDNPCKDAPRGPAKYSPSQAHTRPQMEVHQPPPQASEPGSRNPSQVSIPSTGETSAKEDWELIAKMVDQINDLVKTQIQTTLHEVVPKVIEYLLDSQQVMIKAHSAPFLQGEGDGGSVAEPSGRQYSLVSGAAGSSTWQPPSASQQRSVTAGPSPGASQTSWGEAVGQFGKQTLPRFMSNFPSVLQKVQPVTVTSPRQPSNALQQPRVPADLPRQASQMSWGVARGQFEQPLSSFSSSPASIPSEVQPVTVTSPRQPSNAWQQQRVAADLPRQASQMSWGVARGQFGQPLSSFDSSLASIPSEVQPVTVTSPRQPSNAWQQQRVAADLPRQASQMSQGVARGLFGQPLSSFSSSPASIPSEVQPVTVTSPWQPSNAWQQQRVAADLPRQASQMSWGVARGQFGQPLSSFSSSPASIPSEVQPVTVTSPWQPSNAWQQQRVAADLPRQASQMSQGVARGQFGQPLSSFNSSPASIPPEVQPATVRPADGARPTGEVQRYASMVVRGESDPPRFRNLGISFDTSAVVECGLLNVGTWHLDSSSAQQESGRGASSSDYNPEGCL
ncbi:uncharacterized protein LOC119466309 [Dermacentor silvarum]|uniref:uncharacterized protein LOC119466309 n=1 Tax=Dermacentor silvarum TaxID=543639 RepID=UPI00210197F5|nr:uncharacterized protein LOC119466309 [Dermacentor silvarum]